MYLMVGTGQRIKYSLGRKRNWCVRGMEWDRMGQRLSQRIEYRIEYDSNHPNEQGNTTDTW